MCVCVCVCGCGCGCARARVRAFVCVFVCLFSFPLLSFSASANECARACAFMHVAKIDSTSQACSFQLCIANRFCVLGGNTINT